MDGNGLTYEIQNAKASRKGLRKTSMIEQPALIAHTEWQTAALPMRWDQKGQLFVLMVTSRGTGRWVMPKGWMMDGKKPWRAAEIEALQEAGAVGAIGSQQLGVFHYVKVLDDGTGVPVRVRLYPMIVEKLKKRWKERNQRKRKWFTVKSAAKRVDEPELREILLSLAQKPHKQPAVRQLLKEI